MVLSPLMSLLISASAALTPGLGEAAQKALAEAEPTLKRRALKRGYRFTPEAHSMAILPPKANQAEFIGDLIIVEMLASSSFFVVLQNIYSRFIESI